MGQAMDKIKAGFVVFATDDTREGIIDAREWLNASGLTPQDARLYRHNGQTLVELLKPCCIKPIDTPPPHLIR